MSTLCEYARGAHCAVHIGAGAVRLHLVSTLCEVFWWARCVRMLMRTLGGARCAMHLVRTLCGELRDHVVWCN